MAGNIYNHHLEVLAQRGFNPHYPLNVLIVGATGSGKSSTINALLDKNVAKIGEGADPETMDIRELKLNESVHLWDTPGLGDGKIADTKHKNLIKAAFRKRINGELMQIHFVLVIVNASSRDLGTTFNVINECVKPQISPLKILYAINKCDLATHPKDWDCEANKPNERLHRFLDEQVKVLKKRIYANTGIYTATPVFYSALRLYGIQELYTSILQNALCVEIK